MSWLCAFLAVAALALACAPKLVARTSDAAQADDLEWTVESEPEPAPRPEPMEEKED